MGASLLHVGAGALCAHGGSVQFIPSQARVTVGGMPALTLTDVALGAGPQGAAIVAPRQPRATAV